MRYRDGFYVYCLRPGCWVRVLRVVKKGLATAHRWQSPPQPSRAHRLYVLGEPYDFVPTPGSYGDAWD